MELIVETPGFAADPGGSATRLGNMMLDEMLIDKPTLNQPRRNRVELVVSQIRFLTLMGPT